MAFQNKRCFYEIKEKDQPFIESNEETAFRGNSFVNVQMQECFKAADLNQRRYYPPGDI